MVIVDRVSCTGGVPVVSVGGMTSGVGGGAGVLVDGGDVGGVGVTSITTVGPQASAANASNKIKPIMGRNPFVMLLNSFGACAPRS